MKNKTGKKFLRRLLAGVLAVCLTLGGAGSAFAISTNAVATCVMDVDSGRVLYSNNANKKRPIASITKIMTGLLACELSSEEDLEQVLTCSETANAEKGSSLYMEVGDKITLRSCIYGAMLRSGNDAAMLLAETVAGDEESFVALMNEKAQELGMENTLYGNPNGLVDEGNYSTAYDMCLLGCYAMQNELFAEIVGTTYIETEDGWKIENHNQLLGMDSRCIGIKTGYTSAAGRTLVSCFEDPDTGQRIVCCTLADSYDYQDHIAVYDWAFETYPTHTFCEAGDVVTTLTAGGTDYTLTAADTVSYPLTDAEAQKVYARMRLPQNSDVTIQEGDVVGRIVYYLSGEEIGRTDLIYTPQTEAE
ncbi:MAG: D-alanyl-D-alanine carboxypeptidase [Clostridiales bacterium]|nr:D-alanyl-D-alanine carboxypeptidase [Clostridiales bacterium]